LKFSHASKCSKEILKILTFFSVLKKMGLYDDNDQEVVRLGGGWAAATQQVFYGFFS